MQPRIHSKVLEENNNDFDERDILNPIWQSKEQLSAKPVCYFHLTMTTLF